MPAGALLSRSAARTAELGDAAVYAEAVDAVPRLEPFRVYAELDLAPEAWAVLAVVDGIRTTGKVAAVCGLTVPEGVDVVGALVAEGLLGTHAEPSTPPVALPAPRATADATPAPPPVDDLQVVHTPENAEGTDTAAFLRELSGLTGAGPAVPVAATPVSAPSAPARSASAPSASAPAKPARRRLFGR
jgi:hypothetical protein